MYLLTICFFLFRNHTEIKGKNGQSDGLPTIVLQATDNQ